MRRILGWTGAVLALLVVAGVVGIAWYYSGEILLVEEDEPPVYDTTILEADRREVVLEANEGSARPGTWGLELPDGYARVGDLTADSDEGVVRPLTAVDGAVEAGDEVRLDGYAYPPDPQRADFDFAVDEVDVKAPLGDQPAWFAPANQDRWAIFVHGRAGGRHECFRLLPLFHDLDFSSLCVSYRNDPGTPADPEGIYRQGDVEWQDVEPAVEFARDQGAEQVVLVGFSMGGQIAANLLRRSPLATEIDAVIWDAPLLDWGPAIAQGARNRDVPSWLVPLGMAASEIRAGVDYDELNQIEHAREFRHPVLLFHGTADETVPVSVSDRFAEARPDLVTYVRIEGAEHVRSWNVDPQGYESAVRSFLEEHADG